MANNHKTVQDTSYSIKLGPTFSRIFGRRTKTSKPINRLFLAEDVKVRSISAQVCEQPLHRCQSSKSLKQPTLSEFEFKSNQQSRVSFNTNLSRNRSISKNKKKIKTKNESNDDIIRHFNEQKRLLRELLAQHKSSLVLPSVDVIKQILLEVLQREPQLQIKHFEQTVIETIEQELQKISSKPIDNQTITQLEHILSRILDKSFHSINETNQTLLTNLFIEQKQMLIEALTQQQQTSSIDCLRQALIAAFNEYHSASTSSILTTNIPQVNQQIEIHVDLKRTRNDVAFRQQRDTIVANRYFRESIREWSNVRSISTLISNIQESGSNPIEYAWLLFFWIGKYIRYGSHCRKNSLEDILQHRLASTNGFVDFYQQCCSLLNIQCLIIEGSVKQNDNFQQISHRWNAIIIDENTYLIDVTWSIIAGRLHELADFYFLMSPEEFIYTHFSKDYQLLEPKLTEVDFRNLPLMKSNYFRLNLNLLSPKQIFNQITENLFQISLKIPAYVDLIASLQIKNLEYPSLLHTLCQHDVDQIDRINCFFAPPTNGLYEIILYAKTIAETDYQETIYMELNVTNIHRSITFPIRSSSFIRNKCILIEPFRRLVQRNERLVFHMKIPNAISVKIKNGHDVLVPNDNEYENNILKKQIQIQGDIHICARWNEKIEKFSTICIFHMI